jgi:hypothetical protein
VTFKLDVLDSDSKMGEWGLKRWMKLTPVLWPLHNKPTNETENICATCSGHVIAS